MWSLLLLLLFSNNLCSGQGNDNEEEEVGFYCWLRRGAAITEEKEERWQQLRIEEETREGRSLGKRKDVIVGRVPWAVTTSLSFQSPETGLSTRWNSIGQWHARRRRRMPTMARRTPTMARRRGRKTPTRSRRWRRVNDAEEEEGRILCTSTLAY